VLILLTNDIFTWYELIKGMDEASLMAHMVATKVKTIEKIQIGKHLCETWYYSPFPAGF